MKTLTSGFFIIALWIVFPVSVFSQGTAINESGTTAHPSAILDIDQTNSGILIPRLTEEQMKSIHSPADGLWVFNISDATFYLFDSAEGTWKSLSFESKQNKPSINPRPHTTPIDSIQRKAQIKNTNLPSSNHYFKPGLSLNAIRVNHSVRSKQGSYRNFQSTDDSFISGMHRIQPLAKDKNSVAFYTITRF